MLGPRAPVLVISAMTLLASLAPETFAGTVTSRTDTDIHGVYERLEPGMTVEEVAVAADSRQLRTAPRPVASWVVWSSSGPSRATAVLRATFREERLVRLEYEVFGDQYRRLVKGSEPETEIYWAELRRLWHQSQRTEEAADACQVALEVYHRLTLGVQERLTQNEQAAWARALQLRRGAQESTRSSPPPR